MKTKLLIILCLLGTLAIDASARFTITISGGGRNNSYYRVYVSNNRVECTGDGYNKCIVNFSGSGVARTIFHPFNDVMAFVLENVRNGRKTGSINYKNDLPVNWKTDSQENVLIEINETALQNAK